MLGLDRPVFPVDDQLAVRSTRELLGLPHRRHLVRVRAAGIQGLAGPQGPTHAGGSDVIDYDRVHDRLRGERVPWPLGRAETVPHAALQALRSASTTMSITAINPTTGKTIRS